MDYKKGVPSKINDKFLSRRVDAAFISSIRAKGQNSVDLGIVAKKEVLSVLVIPSINEKSDTASATSNVLAKILDIKGEVIIGDNALRYYLQNKPHIDLAAEWNSRYNKPFVFAVLCYHKDKKTYQKIQKEFLKRKVRIPQYILEKASKKSNIQKQDILRYLEYISYHLDTKAKLGLKKFYKKVSF